MAIRQNRQLKSALAHADARMETLKPGKSLSPFAARTLDGRPQRVDFDAAAAKHLLFVLSTTCPHCEKTLVPWGEIAAGSSGSACRILGVSVHDAGTTREYVDRMNVRFDVVSAADSNFTQAHKIPGFPETILLGRGGVVEKTWIGELSKDQVAEIRALIREQPAARAL